MKNRLAALILITTAALTLTGCWNRRDPENLALVLATAFDYNNETQKYEVIAQMANPIAMGGEDAGQGGGGEKKTYWTVYGDGAASHQAMRNLTLKVSREFFWAHNRVFVFSESIARKGIYPIMDMSARERQLRASAHVAVAEGDIKKLMEAEFPLEEGGAKGLDRQIATIIYERSLFPEKTLNELYSTLSQPGVEMFIGRIKVIADADTPAGGEGAGASESPTTAPPVLIGGGALFKGDRMVGWADEQETIGWAYASGRVFRSMLYIKDPVDDKTPIGIDIEGVENKMHLESGTEGPRIIVEIKARGHLHDIPVDRDLTLESGYIKSLEQRGAQEIRNAVHSAIDLSRRMESDIIGFGNLIYRKQPRLWNEIGDRWYEVFKDIEIDVRVNMNIRRTGLIASPLAAEKRR
jgi:spore germination protein KC